MSSILTDGTTDYSFFCFTFVTAQEHSGSEYAGGSSRRDRGEARFFAPARFERVTSPRDLLGARQCLPLGWTTSAQLRRMQGLGELTVVDAPLMADCLHSVLSGDSDFVVMHSLGV